VKSIASKATKVAPTSAVIFQDYKLNIDTFEIWHGAIGGDSHDQHLWQILDVAEQANALKIKNDLLRNRYIAAHGRLRKILADSLNESPEKINIKKAEYGKPYLVDTPELVFNLSHSANAIVIALGYNCRLGVDIESCKPRTSMAALVDKCFAEEEITYWNNLPEAQKTPEFYRYWTRKEAFVKATGRGIALGLNHCVINPENQTEFLRVPASCGLASTWHVLDIALGQDVCSAFVTDKAINGVRLIDLEASS
jgi:4'-phosphopantetheinyl transferase